MNRHLTTAAIVAYGAAFLALTGCSDIQHFGATAIEFRKTQNSLQAKATLAATCDISIGAFFRDLSTAEQRFVALVCGGEDITAIQRELEAESVRLERMAAELVREREQLEREKRQMVPTWGGVL